MTELIQHTIEEGTVDTGKEHIKIVYGDERIPICILQPQGDAFVVQFLIEEDETNGKMIRRVERAETTPDRYAYAVDMALCDYSLWLFV